jgi:hypothetical protein
VGKPEVLSGSQTENSSLVDNNIAPSKDAVNFKQKERSVGQSGESEINQKSHQPFANRSSNSNIIPPKNTVNNESNNKLFFLED